ncbi:anthranilate phosphoribosyltransferase [Acidisoma cladoniae]|jgi:anthranilate phosphoribosyltransferase|uniref:anthranilate phosphoribosyltransferase n=1 Tax=Acidisoma cladoniae TaxID=3040935 RepID=UPI00254F9464|nr:anthranilate phosphoribosyltransferase [Acidisoma sp. PAMC 29798]
MTGIRPLLAPLARGESLTEAEAEAAFGAIMTGEATHAQIGGMLMAMRVRGETVAEMVGAVRALRARMVAITAPPGAIDVCGTGGDEAGTLNISTAVTFVVAGCGVPVAKHGNRALSSKSGAADVLEYLGVRVTLPPAQLETLLATTGCAFLFAPSHHPALRHAAPVRAELGTRTLFNLLGPLANPARVTRQFTGVFASHWTRPVAEALGKLGTSHAWIVHGQGLDELTLAGDNHITILENGIVRDMTLHADEVGLPRAPLAALRGGDAAHNAGALMQLLQGEAGAYRDTVVLNAAAALIVAGAVTSLTEGIAASMAAIDSGAARAALETLRRASEPPIHEAE